MALENIWEILCRVSTSAWQTETEATHYTIQYVSSCVTFSHNMFSAAWSSLQRGNDIHVRDWLDFNCIYYIFVHNVENVSDLCFLRIKSEYSVLLFLRISERNQKFLLSQQSLFIITVKELYTLYFSGKHIITTMCIMFLIRRFNGD